MGLMAPPSTWYRPRNERVRSTARTSFDSSTTQITAGSRRGSRQIVHSSCSVTLPQTVQNLTLSLTVVMASTSRFMSWGSASRMWNASRCADLGPTPGRRPSSSISSWTAPSYTIPSLVRCGWRAGQQVRMNGLWRCGGSVPGHYGTAVRGPVLDQLSAQNTLHRRTSEDTGLLNGFVVGARDVLYIRTGCSC